MLEPILITIGPIAIGLLAFVILRPSGKVSSETDVVAEYRFPGEIGEVGTVGKETELAQLIWRRSYAK